MIWAQVLLIPFSFLCGSIPFAVIVGRMRGIDVMTQGSCNPGASNVYRLAGPIPGIMVFLLDVAKGALPALAGMYLAVHDLSGNATEPSPVLQIWLELGAGFSAAFGHIFSPFLKFKGGKGVATFLGVFLVIFPAGILTACALAAVAILITRYFSVGSILGAIVLPVSYFFFVDPVWAPQNVPVLCLTLLASVVILIRHRENISRLIKGTEHKTRHV